MNKIIISTALVLLAVTTGSVQAKDKHKNKHKDHHRDRHEYSERESSRYRDRSRTIYVIERDRPVQRVVYVDSGGRYYQRAYGRRSYVRQHYFESYPSRYYTSSGQRRINISLPF